MSEQDNYFAFSGTRGTRRRFRKNVVRSLVIVLSLAALAGFYFLSSWLADRTSEARTERVKILQDDYGFEDVSYSMYDSGTVTITVDGTRHKCFDFTDEQIKASEPIQCENGVELRAH